MTYTDSNVVLPAFYALKATFIAELEQEKVPSNALAFIGDAKQIYTHGIYFDLGTDKENTISAALLALNNRVDSATEIQVGGETPTDSNIKIYIDESEDATAEVYTKSQSDSKFVVVTTLNSAPTSSTTTYLDNGVSKNYKIGDKIIIPSTGKVYTLVQLSGGTATWNLGGGENVQANWSQTDSTAADYIKNKPIIAGLSDSVVCIESNSAPTSSTTQYTDAFTLTRTYKVGDQIKVYNSADQKYDIYVLYNLSNGVATWEESNNVTVTNTVNVNLATYVNGVNTIGTDLIGVVVTLTNTTDSEVVSTHTIVSGETSCSFTELNPLKDYSVSVSSISGYTQPAAQTISEIGVGVSVTKTFQYQADGYTIVITSDQGASDPAISEAVVTINSTDYENGDTIKFATGTSQSDIEALCSATDVAEYAVGVTVNTTNKTITAAYELAKEFVDLGLPSGKKWAIGNLVKGSQDNYSIGAETDLGTYVSWGNIIGHNEGEGYNFDQTTYNSTAGASVSADIPSNDSAHDICVSKLGSAWHLPTKADFQELYDNTDNEWTTINGVNGRKFMKKTDHSVYVFFPTSGLCTGTLVSSRHSNSYYWSASFSSSTKAYYLFFNNSSINTQSTVYDRYYGYTVRPVRYPNKIKLRLTTTDNSSNAGIIVEVSNGSSITWYLKTDSNGAITTSLPDGTYTLASFSHSLNVSTVVVSGNTTVNISATKMEYVDLGLTSGVKWATCNLGASSPTEAGDYFSWGNIIGHAKDSGYSFDPTTYNSTPGASLTANISSSDSAHDAALAIKGSPWRMPTSTELSELLNTCTISIINIQDKKFYKLTSNINSKSIIIPQTGAWANNTAPSGDDANINSSTYTSSSQNKYVWIWGEGNNYDVNRDGARYAGKIIRPVQ